MVVFEQKLPNEEIDSANILRGILKVQAAYAAEGKRPLGRGTHTKGICARATFEVFDIARKIGDPALASRLSQGIYARPGVYSATVRFANAASTIYSDRAPDLRALSFSVDTTPGAPSGPTYQDYSLQTAPTFPINDAHSFAVMMKVLSAGSGAQKLKAIASLSLRDFFRFLKGATLGGIQKHGKLGPYQKLRYWSTVPFRNGPFEAVKYTATPSPSNPAQPLQDEPNALRDELIRHLNDDSEMSSFDFGIQLLDVEHMRRWGFRRKASFWVENATVKWNEKQAPFHVIGRLTLIPKSEFPIEECEPRYIDVTEHATPDTQPLGSVNRARLATEMASRKIRRGEATAESILEGLPTAPVDPPSAFGILPKLAAIGALALFVGYFFSGFVYHRLAARTVPALQHIDNWQYLNQGWGLDRDAADRETYYYTPQGTSMHGVRYSWFVNLEQPFSHRRFSDPDHMRALDFIVDPVATPKNPDMLPIGFARRFDSTIQENVVDITCSACHTGQLNITRNGVTTAIRIDGGPALTAFTDVKPGSFQMDLVLGMIETTVNPLKFNRFANKVLGPNANSITNKIALWRSLTSVTAGLIKVSRGSSNPHLYPVQEGYGRTDALARISNVVFGDHISKDNYNLGNAPVSYPYLWNIWKFDWEQYNASVSQPMARNVGEALGVGASYAFVDKYGRPIPLQDRYRTSVSFDNLLRIESTLQKLTPPQWPEDLLGSIDHVSANRGEILFQQHCVRCHGPRVASPLLKHATSPGRHPDDPMWLIEGKPVGYIGTDPATAVNFVKNTVDLTPAGIPFDEAKQLMLKEYEEQKTRTATLITGLQQAIAHGGLSADAMAEYKQELAEAQDPPDNDAYIAQTLNSIDMHQVNAGVGLNILGLIIRNRYYADQHMSKEEEACFAGFDALDTPQVEADYKPRPLQGVWATPPFLHNGSVPNLYELLSPVSERSTRFFVGRREFDPVHVGFVTTPAPGTKGGFWFDTTIPGNHNTGHEFSKAFKPAGGSPAGVIGPELSSQDRLDLIEYLKVRVDDTTPQDRKPVDCYALTTPAPGPAQLARK